MSKVKYPILGYAPGNYQCRCSTCEDFFFGDKMAVQCEPCAVNCMSLTLTASVGRIQELEKEVEKLKKGLADSAQAYNDLYDQAATWREESGN